MRRMKWFLPADDRPFNPLGCPSSGSRADVRSLEGRKDGPRPTRATRRSDLVETSGPPAPAMPSAPPAPSVHGPRRPCRKEPVVPGAAGLMTDPTQSHPSPLAAHRRAADRFWWARP